MDKRHHAAFADKAQLIVLVSAFLFAPATANVAVSQTAAINAGAIDPIAEPGAMHGAAFYVSPGGNDDNSGQSPSLPFRTLEKARAAMRELGLKPFTTYLEGGLYPRAQVLNLTDYNDQNKAWISYSGQTPILDGDGKVTQGINIEASGVTVTGITIQNFSQSGLFVKYCDNILIDDNKIFNIATPDWRTDVLGSSIFLLRVKKSMVIRNHIDGNKATGIQVNGGGAGDDNSDVVVSHNEIHNTCAAVNDCGAIYFRDLGHVSRRQRIDNNVIANFGSRSNEDVAIYLDDETSNVTVSENIVYGAGTYAVLIHGGDHNVFRNNIFDVSRVDKLGLYQDDVGSGGLNYGMAYNRFTRNVVYSSASLPKPLWDYIDQSRETIILPEVSTNIYYAPDPISPNEGAIVDSHPIHDNPRFTNPDRHDYRFLSGSPALILGFRQQP
jgi:hypothetical protein